MSAVRKAIDEHRTAMEYYLALSHYYAGMLPSSDRYKLAHDASTAASTVEAKAWSTLQCERPTTVEDLAAYAIHLTQVVREFDHETEATSETAEAFEALSSACLSLAGQERLR